MRVSLDRRALLKAGGAVTLSAVGVSAVADRADANHATATGRIAVERLWRYYYKYVKTSYVDSRGRRRTRYVKTKVLRSKNTYEGTATKTLNYGGLCHWIGTARPLSNGNCVMFGHRTSYGGPLRYTHRMKVGDQIVLEIDGQGSKTYRVAEPPKVITSRDFAEAINWGDRSRSNLTLVACTRSNGLPTSTKFRLLIRATEVDGTEQGSTTPPPQPPPPSARPTLRRGSTGSAVSELQQLLTDRGFPTAVDGQFGPGTERTVKAFQASRRLTPDGVVGPVTWAALAT